MTGQIPIFTPLIEAGKWWLLSLVVCWIPVVGQFCVLIATIWLFIAAIQVGLALVGVFLHGGRTLLK